jgi:predicted nucleotidyltransferase
MSTIFPAANREQIRDRLIARRGELARLGVASLALFGSAARGGMAVESDVDILVEFAEPATFDGYMDLKFFLEDLLGRRVDLVTDKALKPALRSRIADELVDVT